MDVNRRGFLKKATILGGAAFAGASAMRFLGIKSPKVDAMVDEVASSTPISIKTIVADDNALFMADMEEILKEHKREIGSLVDAEMVHPYVFGEIYRGRFVKGKDSKYFATIITRLEKCDLRSRQGIARGIVNQMKKAWWA